MYTITYNNFRSESGLENKKKKLGLGILFTSLVILFGTGIFIFFETPSDKVSADKDEKEKIEVVEEEKEKEKVVKEEQIVVEPYASVLTEGQEVLKEEELSGVYHLSLLSETPVEDQAIVSLMKEVVRTHDKEDVTVKVFETKEAYEKDAIDSNDKNAQVQVFAGTSLKGTPSILKTIHQSVTVTAGHIDDMGYDVQDAVINENKVTYQVVVSGNENNLESFLNGFIEIHKDLNPNDQQVSLELYLSADALQAKNPAWTYDGNTITKKEYITEKAPN